MGSRQNVGWSPVSLGNGVGREKMQLFLSQTCSKSGLVEIFAPFFKFFSFGKKNQTNEKVQLNPQEHKRRHWNRKMVSRNVTKKMWSRRWSKNYENCFFKRKKIFQVIIVRFLVSGIGFDNLAKFNAINEPVSCYMAKKTKMRYFCIFGLKYFMLYYNKRTRFRFKRDNGLRLFNQ